MSSFVTRPVLAQSLPSAPASAERPMRWAHVDINSYFATLLQQENPALRGKPVGVVKDVGRTCVIAASKEAKKLGIPTGCGLREARQKAPNLIVVPAAFDMYLSATRRLCQIFANLSPEVHVFSLDEAFINLTGCERLYPTGQVFGELVQQQIKAELGEWVTCNVGLSHTRLLAKMAGEMAPKGSIVEITEDNKIEWLARATFDQVCGVGFRLAAKLERIGVTHPWQINFVPDADLEKLVGPFWASELRKIGQGEETHFFTHPPSKPYMQSVGRSLTGYRLCDDERVIQRVMYNLIMEVMHKVRKLNLAGYRVSLGLRGGRSGDPQYWYQELRVGEPIRRAEVMFDLLYHRLYRSWRRTFPIIKISVRLSDLHPWETTQPVLWPEWHQRERVATALDKLTARYGLFTVRPGTLLTKHLIQPEVTGYLGDKNYQLDSRWQ